MSAFSDAVLKPAHLFGYAAACALLGGFAVAGGLRWDFAKLTSERISPRYISESIWHARTPFYAGRFHTQQQDRSSSPLRSYSLPRALAHAATKRELVAKQRPPHWTPPSIFRPPEALSEAEVIEAEAELKALQRHATI